jgi:alkanesulfonate monooxygenase SsuD/methylene tetrahydromethanopterin reductase-like flavin-dependent oxidoreductase (luciferase family)
MPSIGFNVAPDYSIAEQVDLARRCEELGYDDVWVSEISDPDAFVVAAAMALATSRVRLGTAIVTLGPRSVPILASAAASVAELSGGRFTLGVGVSTPAIVTGWHGIPSERPLERARESIPVLRALLGGQRSDSSALT